MAEEAARATAHYNLPQGHYTMPKGNYSFPSFSWLKQAHYRATTPGAGAALLNRRARLQKRERQHGSGTGDEVATSDAGSIPSA